jgi:hypothetical protein
MSCPSPLFLLSGSREYLLLLLRREGESYTGEKLFVECWGKGKGK